MEKNITIYSCSGCSNLAQLANSIAIKIHRDKIATMSCIAGVGGDVAPLVRVALESKQVIAIDGCPLACVKKCLSRHQIIPDIHIVLTDLSLSKNIYTEASTHEFDTAYEHVLEKINILKVQKN
jgi:uncharacterized metal-binding protein